jgi:hypothetical protein
MAAMGSMGSRAHLWLDTLSIALKRVLLMRSLQFSNQGNTSALVIYFPEHGSSSDTQLTLLEARNYSDMSHLQVNPSYPQRGTSCAYRNQFW